MKMPVRNLLLFVFLAVSQFCCVRYSEVKKVPIGFEYPEYGITIQYEKVLLFHRVAGKVIAPNGERLSEVLVEIRTSDHKKRLSAVFTDANGNFEFRNLNEGDYFMRLTKSYFAPLQANIRVAKSGKNSFKFVLMLAT
jgi:hypothetical protein